MGKHKHKHKGHKKKHAIGSVHINGVGRQRKRRLKERNVEALETIAAQMETLAILQAQVVDHLPGTQGAEAPGLTVGGAFEDPTEEEAVAAISAANQAEDEAAAADTATA